MRQWNNETMGQEHFSSTMSRAAMGWAAGKFALRFPGALTFEHTSLTP